MRLIGFLALLMLVSVPDCCSAQSPKITVTEVSQSSEPITLVETKSFVWSGFVNPRVVDGRVVAEVTSKPKFEGSTSQILLTLSDGYEISEILAESLPSLEYIDLAETPAAGSVELQFPADAKAGDYRIAVKASKKGVSRQAIKRLNVTIGGSGPGPEPPEPILPEMSQLAKDSRKAMQTFVIEMAGDMDKAAEAIDAGKLKTVLDLSAFTTPLDIDSRNRFKKTMAVSLEPKLGKDQLPADASKTLREVATGFRSVK